MAVGVEFEQQNDWLGKPENMSNHQVYALPICRAIIKIPGVIPSAPNQTTFGVLSKWRLSPEELEEAIRTGGDIFVRFIGNTHPALYVSSFFPIFTDLGERTLTEEEIKILKSL